MYMYVLYVFMYVFVVVLLVVDTVIPVRYVRRHTGKSDPVSLSSSELSQLLQWYRNNVIYILIRITTN